MKKSVRGWAAVFSLGLGVAIMGHIMIFNPYGGHSVAVPFLFSLLLIAVGVILGIVHLI